MTKQDLLEKQLEGLFSDIALTDVLAVYQNSSTAAAVLQPGLIPTIGGKWLRKPQWLNVPKATPGSLSALASFAVLAFLLVEKQGVLNQTSRAAPPPTEMANRIAYDRPPTATWSAPARPTAIFTATPKILPLTPTPALSSVAAPTRVSPTSTTPPTATPSPVPTSTSAPTSTPTATPTQLPTATPSPMPTATPTQLPTATPSPMPTATATHTPLPTATVAPPPAQVQANQSPTRLLIPAIDLVAPVQTVGLVNYKINGQQVTTWAVPERFAAGWHQTSALPGQVGNTVINGHQNIHGMVFRDLNALQQGDEIIVYAGDTAHHYRVAEKHLLAEEGQPLEVRVQNAQWIMPTSDERLTLITCAPDTKSTHRLIVVAVPAGN